MLPMDGYLACLQSTFHNRVYASEVSVITVCVAIVIDHCPVPVIYNLLLCYMWPMYSPLFLKAC